MSAIKAPYHIHRDFGRYKAPYKLCSSIQHDSWSAVVVVRSMNSLDEGRYQFKPTIIDMGNAYNLLTIDEFDSKRWQIEREEGEAKSEEWATFAMKISVANPRIDNNRWEAYKECLAIIEHFKHLAELGLIELGYTG